MSATTTTIDALAVQPDGKIVVAGGASPQVTTAFMVSRYAKDGSEDPTFNSNPVEANHSGPVASLALQRDRKIVIAGSTGPDSGHMDFIVLRFLNPALPSPKCRVPNVRGKTLATARRTITRARCKVGKVSRKPSSRVKKGRVISQKPRAGRVLAVASKVSLVVSRGRPR